MTKIQGIYKITNILNGHSYIGQSVNIYERWKAHKREAFNNSLKNRQYDKALYRAIRNAGIEKFEFSILEVVEKKSDLDAREKYWITYYGTNKEGYNETPGGAGEHICNNEKHHNHKLTTEDVIDIRIRWSKCQESVCEIFKDYSSKISKTGFKKIYTWQTWIDILPELNTDENRYWHAHNSKAFSNPGELNPTSKLTDDQVRNIRTRYKNGESIKSLYEEYKYTGISLGSFRNTACGYNRKYI